MGGLKYNDVINRDVSLPGDVYSAVMNKAVKRKQKLSFDEMGLSQAMRQQLAQIKYLRPSPIQAGLIPLAMEDHDVVGQAQTGTGKTAAFSIPIIERLDKSDLKNRVPQALILVPTRELAVQVHDEFVRLSKHVDASVVAIYGGKPIKAQARRLEQGVDVVVATPGRAIDHLGRHTLDLSKLWCVVLDEADRMLDIGFRPDIERILRRCPTDRQTLLLSATVPDPIIRLAKRYMNNPVRVNFSPKQVAAETIDQSYFYVEDKRKFDLLVALLERDQPEQAIVFCRTKIGTEKLYRKLLKGGKFDRVAAIHGDMTQPGRDKVMKKFRDGSVNLLIATDVVGRGIDVTQISHIINFDIPQLSEDYVHRVGRTGRMGKTGSAYSFITPDQGPELTAIEQLLNQLLKRDNIEGFEVEPNKPGGGLRRKPKKRYRRAL
jgi:ATP-dependent RNA helicase DeaD